VGPNPICVLRIRKYFLSLLLFAHNSTYLYPAVRSILTELFGLHPACRHETYIFTIFQITLYFPRCVCAVLQIWFSSVTGYSSHLTKVTTISFRLPHSVSFHRRCLFTFNPLNTKAIKSYDYSTSFLFSVCASCHQFLWRRKTTDWFRSQLLRLVIRGLDKTSEITVSKDACSVAQLFAALPYNVEVRGSILDAGVAFLAALILPASLWPWYQLSF
jgi:small basic protein